MAARGSGPRGGLRRVRPRLRHCSSPWQTVPWFSEATVFLFAQHQPCILNGELWKTPAALSSPAPAAAGGSGCPRSRGRQGPYVPRLRWQVGCGCGEIGGLASRDTLQGLWLVPSRPSLVLEALSPLGSLSSPAPLAPHQPSSPKGRPCRLDVGL